MLAASVSLTRFFNFRKQPSVPYRISQLCDMFVEGFNTTLHPCGLEGCWRTPSWLHKWGIAWKVQPAMNGEIHLNFRYKDQNDVLAYGASTDVRNIIPINSFEVLIVLSVGAPGSGGKLYGIIVASQFVTDELCNPEVLETGFQVSGNTTVVPEHLAENWEFLSAARDAAQPKDSKKKPQAKKKKQDGSTIPKSSQKPSQKKKTKKKLQEEKDQEEKEKELETVEELLGTLSRAVKLGMGEEEISAINRKLCEHLDGNFPYKRNTIGVKVHSDQLHVAPREMKYRDLIERRVEQLVVEYGSFSAIRCRPPIFAVPLIKKPSEDSNDLANLGINLVMEKVPDMSEPLSSDPTKKWFNTTAQHWYIIGGQHTVVACNRIASRIATTDEEKQNLLHHDVIVVHSHDPSRYATYE